MHAKNSEIMSERFSFFCFFCGDNVCDEKLYCSSSSNTSLTVSVFMKTKASARLTAMFTVTMAVYDQTPIKYFPIILHIQARDS